MGIVIALCGLVGIFERVTGRWANRFLLVGTLLVVPLVLVMSLGLATGSKQTNLIPLLVESLRLGTPIALGALAGLWCERSGVVNIGIEGMMLMSAGVSFTVYAVMNGAQGGLPLAVAVLIAVAVGGLMALLHALLCVTFRTDQIISGVVINLLALGRHLVPAQPGDRAAGAGRRRDAPGRSRSRCSPTSPSSGPSSSSASRSSSRCSCSSRSRRS